MAGSSISAKRYSQFLFVYSAAMTCSSSRPGISSRTWRCASQRISPVTPRQPRPAHQRGMAFIHGKYPVYQAQKMRWKLFQPPKTAPASELFLFLPRLDLGGVQASQGPFLAPVKHRDKAGWAAQFAAVPAKAGLYGSGPGKARRAAGLCPWIWLGEYQFKRWQRAPRIIPTWPPRWIKSTRVSLLITRSWVPGGRLRAGHSYIPGLRKKSHPINLSRRIIDVHSFHYDH